MLAVGLQVRRGCGDPWEGFVSQSENRDAMRAALTTGAKCGSWVRLGALRDGMLDEPEARQLRSHLEQCPVCTAEWKLLEDFIAARPEAHERAAVESIAAEVAAHFRPAKENWFAKWFRMPALPQMAGALAGLALVAILGIQWQANHQVTDLSSIVPSEQVRAGTAVVPLTIGDLGKIPTELKWNPVPAAARFEVEISEVDGTELWRNVSTAAFIPLPAAIQARILPRKTLVWEVTAFDAQGSILAHSGPARFRVVP